MKIDEASWQNDLEHLICVIVLNVVIFVDDFPDISLRFVVRRLYMARINSVPKTFRK
jgi:hypothetical protein